MKDEGKESLISDLTLGLNLFLFILCLFLYRLQGQVCMCYAWVMPQETKMISIKRKTGIAGMTLMLTDVWWNPGLREDTWDRKWVLVRPGFQTSALRSPFTRIYAVAVQMLRRYECIPEDSHYWLKEKDLIWMAVLSSCQSWIAKDNQQRDQQSYSWTVIQPESVKSFYLWGIPNIITRIFSPVGTNHLFD